MLVMMYLTQLSKMHRLKMHNFSLSLLMFMSYRHLKTK